VKRRDDVSESAKNEELRMHWIAERLDVTAEQCNDHEVRWVHQNQLWRGERAIF